MRAYGDLIQEPEAASGCDVLTHQKWSGAGLSDAQLSMITGGISSTAAMGAGVTETQFSDPEGKQPGDKMKGKL